MKHATQLLLSAVLCFGLAVTLPGASRHAEAQNAPMPVQSSSSSASADAEALLPAITATDVQIPVLSMPKAIDDIIRADDITFQPFPEKRAGGDVIRDKNQIIGMAARRNLAAGVPIRLIDLRKEQLVKRGEMVTVTFRQGALEITAAGKAIESGALNEVIKVTNLSTNRTVDGKVTGPSQVEVGR